MVLGNKWTPEPKTGANIWEEGLPIFLDKSRLSYRIVLESCEEGCKAESSAHLKSMPRAQIVQGLNSAQKEGK